MDDFSSSSVHCFFFYICTVWWNDEEGGGTEAKEADFLENISLISGYLCREMTSYHANKRDDMWELSDNF